MVCGLRGCGGKGMPGDDPVRSELRHHANAVVARGTDARGSGPWWW